MRSGVYRRRAPSQDNIDLPPRAKRAGVWGTLGRKMREEREQMERPRFDRGSIKERRLLGQFENLYYTLQDHRAIQRCAAP